MTVSKPCYFGNLLLGIVGVDVNLAYILEDVTYYQDSLASYTFLIDDKGNNSVLIVWEDNKFHCRSNYLIWYLPSFQYHINIMCMQNHMFFIFIFIFRVYTYAPLSYQTLLAFWTTTSHRYNTLWEYSKIWTSSTEYPQVRFWIDALYKLSVCLRAILV